MPITFSEFEALRKKGMRLVPGVFMADVNTGTLNVMKDIKHGIDFAVATFDNGQILVKEQTAKWTNCFRFDTVEEFEAWAEKYHNSPSS